MREPRPRRTIKNGQVYWLVREPKHIGTRRFYFRTEAEAQHKLKEFTSSTNTQLRLLNRLTRREQLGLLYVLEKCGDIDQLIAYVNQMQKSPPPPPTPFGR